MKATNIAMTVLCVCVWVFAIAAAILWAPEGSRQTGDGGGATTVVNPAAAAGNGLPTGTGPPGTITAKK